MASAAAATSLPDTILRTLSNRIHDAASLQRSLGQFGWDLLRNIALPASAAPAAKAHAATPAQLHAPFPAHAPHTAEHGAADTRGKPERKISVLFDNTPSGTRISTRATGSAFQVDTAMGASARAMTSAPRAPAASAVYSDAARPQTAPESAAPSPPLSVEQRTQLVNAAIPKALDYIRNATTNSKLTPDQQKDLGHIVDLLTKRSSRIAVARIPARDNPDGNVVAQETTKRGRMEVTVDPTANYLVDAEGKVNMDLLEADLVHEGQHGYDDTLWGNPKNIHEERRTERNAYGIEAAFTQVTGVPLTFTDTHNRAVVLTADTANDIAESSVKDWAEAARANALKDKAKYDLINARNTAENQKRLQWNSAHPYAQKPLLPLYNVPEPPPPYSPPQ